MVRFFLFLALGIGAGMVAVWVRSLFRWDHLVIPYGIASPSLSARPEFHIYSSYGGLWLSVQRRPIAGSVRVQNSSPQTGESIIWRSGTSQGGLRYPHAASRVLTTSYVEKCGFQIGLSRRAATPQTGGLLMDDVHVILPYWFLVIAALVTPAVMAARRAKRTRRARHRLTRGQCVQCGFDLRHSGDRCPECGIKVDKDAPSQRFILNE